MKRFFVLPFFGFSVLFLALLVSGLLVFGCGQQQQQPSTPSPEQPTGPPSGVTSSNIFNVSGAKAIAIATTTSSSGKGSSRAQQVEEAKELLKIDAAGKISSVFNSSFTSSYYQPISVIEKGRDGSLYVGFAWGIYLQDYTTQESSGTEEGTTRYPGYTQYKVVAFFRIKPNGSVEVVDDSITGMGSWYSSGSDYAELPAKIVQFDDAGNVYYLGYSSSSYSGGWSSTQVLKKKTTAGVISQIGTSNMTVRDFLVAPNGTILFHGNNLNNYQIEWLRVYYQGGSRNIFYNDSSQGTYQYLRTYYIDKNGNVMLVGLNLAISPNIADEVKNYSGVTRVTLNATTGQPTTIEVLYDDNNMYGTDTYNTIGSQLNYGYWDYLSGTFKKFLKQTNYTTTLPLSLESGVTEDSIRTYIRGKFKTITKDTLNNVTFEGMTTTTETWNISGMLDDVINANISGETWAQWREANGLQGVPFSSAKQIVFAEDGSVYAVMRLDTWGATATKGDKIFRIVNASGEADPVAYQPHSTYKYVTRARCYGDYMIYLSSKVGYYKIFRVDLANPSSAPQDMTADKGEIEIFSFSYNPVGGMLLYDVYDYNTGMGYLVQQDISSLTIATESSAEAGYKITDVVPFEVTQ